MQHLNILMNKIVILIFLFVFSLLFASEVDSLEFFQEISDSLHIEKIGEEEDLFTSKRIYVNYSGYVSVLHVAGWDGFSGWDVLEDNLTDQRSRFEFGYNFGPEWWKHFSISYSPNEDLFSDFMGGGKSSSIEVYSLEMIFGKSIKYLPEIVYCEENFKATGVVTEANRLYKRGNLLAVGETFDAGLKFSYLAAVWSFWKFFYVGIGESLFEFTGNRLINVDVFYMTKHYSVAENFDYEGGVVLCGFRNDFHVTKYLTFPVNLGFIASTGVGIYYKTGYEVGVQCNFYKDCYVKYWIGSYTWEISSFDFDSEIVDTDKGTTTGLEFSIGIY